MQQGVQTDATCFWATMMRPFARDFRLRYHVMRNFRLGLVVHIIRLVICTSPIIHLVISPIACIASRLRETKDKDYANSFRGENRAYYRRYAQKANMF